MNKYMDSSQEKLHDAVERSDELVSQFLLKANGNENDGRALIELLRGQRTVLIHIDNRLKNIHDELVACAAASHKTLRHIELALTLIMIMAAAAAIKFIW